MCGLLGPVNSWRTVCHPQVQVQAAIFYSVTSTQPGLAGIELGTHLIKVGAATPAIHFICPSELKIFRTVKVTFEVVFGNF
jgi:hypothetical protein